MKYTVHSFLESKKKGEKITLLTAYDYTTAKIIDQAGIHALLVGDSLGMVFQGKDSTLSVTLDEMIYHTKAVTKGVQNAFVIGDMPFLTYHISPAEAVRNAGRLIQEGGASAIKLEGGASMVPTIKALLHAQIPVMGHIGLTPQSIHTMGGFKVQGKDVDAAQALINDALALEQAGVFAIVLEGIPEKLAQLITSKLTIPTIGIGAGRYCDGQILVIHDLLGLYGDMSPKFSKRYLEGATLFTEAIQTYINEVETGVFPEVKHTFSLADTVIDKLY